MNCHVDAGWTGCSGAAVKRQYLGARRSLEFDDAIDRVERMTVVVDYGDTEEGPFSSLARVDRLSPCRTHPTLCVGVG